MRVRKGIWAPGLPGFLPCPELTTRAGILRYHANQTNQIASPDEKRFATGLRNTMALAGRDSKLYAATHGRDELSDNWPTLFSDAQNNEVPAETFARVDEGEDFGWPYCYFDTAKGEHVFAPEYGGDGARIGDCGSKAMPDITFPATGPRTEWHSPATSDCRSAIGTARSSRSTSWQCKPLQAGFLVVFVPFENGVPGRRYAGVRYALRGTRTRRRPE